MHCTVSIVGLLLFEVGMMRIFGPIQTYLIDVLPTFAASAVAALIVLRCLFGSLLPLAGPAMYGGLGLGWGSSLLGSVAMALIPAPLLIYEFDCIELGKSAFRLRGCKHGRLFLGTYLSYVLHFLQRGRMRWNRLALILPWLLATYTGLGERDVVMKSA